MVAASFAILDTIGKTLPEAVVVEEFLKLVALWAPAMVCPPGKMPGSTAGKMPAATQHDICCYPAEIGHSASVLLDGSHLSKAWESSGELGSVMILNPTFGNSLWKVQFVGQ